MEEQSTSLVQDIVNYGIRIIIIVFGGLILFNVFNIQTQDMVTFRVIGGLMVLFGVYRMYSYHIARNRFTKRRSK